MDKDNYKALKNYIHNELGYSKEDIDNLIKQEIEKQVYNYYVKDRWSYEHIKDIVDKHIFSKLNGGTLSISHYIKEIIEKYILEKFNINVSIKQTEVKDEIKINK